MTQRGNRAALLMAPNQIEIRDWPEPTLGPQDVMIEIAAVGVCGSDVHYFQHGRIGDLVVDFPLVLGHEAAGRISAVGSEVSHLSPGDRVTIEPQRPCGRCPECRSGAYNLCADVIFMATPPYHGAFATRVAHAADFTFRIPDTLSFEEAALIEPLAVGFWAAEQAQIRAGSRCLVIGAGPIGLLAAQVALSRGAAEVVVSDIHPQRIASVALFPRLAAHNGQLNPSYQGVLPFDHCIECSGAPAALAAALACMKPRGTVALVGISVNGKAQLDFWPILAKELRLSGVFRYAGIYPRVIALAASGLIDLKSMITHRFDLDHTGDALAQSSRDMASIKSVVLP